MEKESERKPHSHSEHGKDFKGHSRHRNDRKKVEKKDKGMDHSRSRSPVLKKEGVKVGKKKNTDRTRSPVRRKESMEGGKLMEEPMMEFNIGRKQQNKQREGENERDKPAERRRGKWEEYGWSRG